MAKTYAGWTAEDWQDSVDDIVEAIKGGVFDEQLRDIAKEVFDRRDVLRGVQPTSKPDTVVDDDDGKVQLLCKECGDVLPNHVNDKLCTDCAAKLSKVKAKRGVASTPDVSAKPKHKARRRAARLTREDALARSRGVVTTIRPLPDNIEFDGNRHFRFNGNVYAKSDLLWNEVAIRTKSDSKVDGLTVLITGVGPKAIKAVFRDLPPVGHKWRTGMDSNDFVFIPKEVVEHVLGK